MPGDRLPPAQGGLTVGREPYALSAVVEVVSLPNDGERVLGPQSFEDQLKQEDQSQRRWTATRIRHLIDPHDRIVTNQVLMALLDATTVQVGTIAASIARHQFPGRPRGGS